MVRLLTAFELHLSQSSVTNALRSLFFVAAIAFVWVSDKPFESLQGLGYGETERSAASTYALFGTMAALGLLFASRHAVALRTLIVPSSVLFVLWMMLNIGISYDTSASFMRFTLTAFTIILASTVPLLPNSTLELNRAFATAALVLLALCYFGVVFLPDLATHTAKDIVESRLAGDWRGTFGHKNAAAPMMAMLVFIGIYLIRSGTVVSGTIIGLSAGVFLAFSGGKSSTALCIGALLMAALVKSARSYALRAIICFVPLIVMNLLGVGTAISPDLAAAAKLLPFDTTYTGRDEIWKFVFNALSGHALTGYGFGVFWDGPATEMLTAEGAEWAIEASNSHNGYLDTVVSLGLPGLAFILLFCVISPLKNFQAASANNNDNLLTGLFLEIWIFGIYLASMESFFLNRINASWFTFLIAIFGLHYLARFTLKSSEEEPLAFPKRLN